MTDRNKPNRWLTQLSTRLCDTGHRLAIGSGAAFDIGEFGHDADMDHGFTILTLMLVAFVCLNV